VKNEDVRAESALKISSFLRFNRYAKISQIRCPRDFASCHGPGYRTKKDIHYRNHQQYVQKEAALGRRPELVGSGLVRSLGGWSEVLALRGRGEKQRSDQRF